LLRARPRPTLRRRRERRRNEMADGTNEINVCSRPGLENENELHENFRPTRFISESTFTFSKPVSLDCPSDIPRMSVEKSRASVGPIMSASGVNTFLNRDSKSEFNQDPISSDSVPISTLSALLTQSLSVLSGGVDCVGSLNGREYSGGVDCSDSLNGRDCMKGVDCSDSLN
jgi:hypothetical protein